MRIASTLPMASIFATFHFTCSLEKRCLDETKNKNSAFILKMSPFTDTNRTCRPPPQPFEDAVTERKSTGSSQVAFSSNLHGHAATIIPSNDGAQLSKNSANTTGTDRRQRTEKSRRDAAHPDKATYEYEQ